MSLLKFKFQLFFSPDELPTGTGDVPSGMDKEEVIEFLGEDDGNADDKEILELEDKGKKGKTTELPKDEKEDDDDKEEKEETNELDEIEEELKEPEDEDLELITPVSRREILKAYPDLFKKFPYLEKAYFREREFTERFPTMEDADNALNAARTLNAFEKDVANGNMIPILKAAHTNNPEAFAQIVDNYLPALNKIDPNAHLHVIGNVMKTAIYNMVSEANRTKNENLKGAAAILQQFMFGTSEYTPPTNLAKPRAKNEGETELEQRQRQFDEQRYQTAIGELDTRVNNTLKNTIEANIDPKGSMTEFVKKHAVNEVMRNVGELIAGDKRLRSITDRLWQAAHSQNFSPASLDKIRSAYLAKAKTLLPSVIKKARNEALRGMGRTVKDGESREDKKAPVTPGRSRPSNSGKMKPSEIPAGMSTLEFLSKD